MDRSLLSYINTRHANFLLLSLTVGKARDLSPRYTTVEDLALVIDKSTKRVSQCHRVHVLAKEPKALVQVAKSTTTKSVHSPKAESNPGEEEMVTRWTMNID